MNNPKPLHFLILKILGVLLLAVVVTGFVFVFTGFGDLSSNKFMIGGLMTTLGLFGASVCLSVGFSPELAKMRTRSARYIQNENKDELREIATTSAEIASDAVSTVSRAVQDGLRKTVFCKHCGKEIDADSKFCSHCGKML
jgi:hypothetical protein